MCRRHGAKVKLATGGIQSTAGFLRYFTEWAAEIVDEEAARERGDESRSTLHGQISAMGDRSIEILGGPKIFEEAMNHMKSVEKQSHVERAEGF